MGQCTGFDILPFSSCWDFQIHCLDHLESLNVQITFPRKRISLAQWCPRNWFHWHRTTCNGMFFFMYAVIFLKWPLWNRKYCYILRRSFSTSANDRMIHVFTLLRASQTSHLILSILWNPYCSWAILYKDCSFSPGLTRVTPPFGNTSLSERLLEISLTTLMLDLRKKTIKGFRSNQTLFGLTLYS